MEADAIPWERLLVNLIVQYKVRIEGHNDFFRRKYLTIIDPATTWFKIVQ